jgi:capsule polysaccharide export protein KpsE/RkpR
MAQLIARELLVESRALLNDLNAEARAARPIRPRRSSTPRASTGLTAGAAELTAFRTESRMFDPNSDFEVGGGVLRLLQGQLAQALVEQDVQRRADRQRPSTKRRASWRCAQRIEAERDRLIEGVGDRRAPTIPKISHA